MRWPRRADISSTSRATMVTCGWIWMRCSSMRGARVVGRRPWRVGRPTAGRNSCVVPLTGGAFVAQLLAAEIGAGFIFAERFVSETGSVRYRIPESLRGALDGRRVLLADDVVNAGSALLATLADLLDCGTELSGFATLLALGEAASQIARQRGVPLFALASLERGMWAPEECPLCRSGAPLVDRLAQV
jgi:orotate phosphoribosyltransferase